MSSEQSGVNPEIRQHPLVPYFGGQTEADDPEDASEIFVGFVGDARKASAVRVYASLSLGSYCELKKADIISASPLDPKDDLSPTLLRVKADARVEYVRTDRFGGDASYVAGRILSEYGARSAERPTTKPDDTTLMGHPPYPVTPVIYCTSQVYPPC